MLDFLRFVLSDIWRFIGFVILLAMVGDFTLRALNRTCRYMNIRKHGYPPDCDADGDFLHKSDEQATGE